MAEKKEEHLKKDVKTEKKSVLGRVKSIGKKEVRVVLSKSVSGKNPMDVLKLVLMTEKSVRSVELQNKLVFIVDRKADKKDVKSAVEEAFQAEVADVNIMIDQKARKKAFVKFKKPGIAGEVAIKLGII